VAILDKGKIVQIGEPATVYERPRTRFAAEFLGDSNFLPGIVENGGVRLEDGGMVEVAGTLPSAGKKVTLAVRPEKMSPSGDGKNQISAQIKTVIYAGPVLSYHLVTNQGRELKLFSQNRDGNLLREGENVTLSWAPEHTVALVE